MLRITFVAGARLRQIIFCNHYDGDAMATEQETALDFLQMALIFRADLPEMTRAKSEIQAAHAATDLVYELMQTTPDLMHRYMRTVRKKINAEVEGEAALTIIRDKAAKRGVPCKVIEDAGLTIFNGPTVTCLILGPMNKTDSNALTRNTEMRDRERNAG
jgi:peptidyl-tRNA hydrolase